MMVSKFFKYFCFILFSVCFLTCFKSHKFSLEQTLYAGTQLRIDGFYLIHSKGPRKKLRDKYVFYRNGVFQYYGSTKVGDNYKDFSFNRSKLKYGWGLYQIKDRFLKIQYWDANANLRAYVVTEEAEILNDSTFKLLTRVNSENKEKVWKLNHFSYFHQHTPKPDSTNRFFK